MRISIFGTGYVGLVSGTCLAEIGHDVMCVDIDQQKIDNLEKWVIPIYEPWLEELVLRNVKEGRLVFTTDAEKAVDFAEVIFSAVGTPPDKDHKADLQYVKAVATTVATHMQDDKVFVNKSTVPVGTGAICKDIITWILSERGVDFTISMVSNPEFLKEWTAIKDFMVPDRIVCGVEDIVGEEAMRKVYGSFVRANKPLLIMDILSSELVKYAANSFLATKISFINEIANFAEHVGADVSAVATWIWTDDRIGSRFLHAWIGYGWSCFPKDVQALIQSWKEHDYDFRIISATEAVNQEQKRKVVEKLQKHLPDLKWTTIALRWLAFKPKTDDVRDAPSLIVCKQLLDAWVERIQCFDPEAKAFHRKLFGEDERIVYSDRSYDAVQDADALLLLTEWDEFRNVNFETIQTSMRTPVIIDWRNIWSSEWLQDLGFSYEWIWK